MKGNIIRVNDKDNVIYFQSASVASRVLKMTKHKLNHFINIIGRIDNCEISRVSYKPENINYNKSYDISFDVKYTSDKKLVEMLDVGEPKSNYSPRVCLYVRRVQDGN